MGRIVRIPPGYQPRLSATLLDSLRELAAENHIQSTRLLINRYNTTIDPLRHLKQRHAKLKQDAQTVLKKDFCTVK